jgi:integrase
MPWSCDHFTSSGSNLPGRYGGCPIGDGAHQAIAFQTLVHRSGLPRLRFHDLRHTHATLLLKAGVPIKVVSERLGHSTPGFTMATYQHVIPGMQQQSANGRRHATVPVQAAGRTT